MKSGMVNEEETIPLSTTSTSTSSLSSYPTASSSSASFRSKAFHLFFSSLFLIVLYSIFNVIYDDNELVSSVSIFSGHYIKVALFLTFPQGLETTLLKDSSILKNISSSNECTNAIVQSDKDSYRKIILSKSFCSYFANEENPNLLLEYHNISKSSFQKSCRSKCQSEHFYDETAVDFIFHVYSHPMDHIASRFHSYQQSHSTEYSADKNGFLKYCQDRDELYYRQEAPHLPEEYLSAARDVPCRSDFFRYIQWHNQVNLLKHEMNVPYNVIYHKTNVDAFESQVINSLTQYLNGVYFFMSNDETKEDSKIYKDYYSQEERQNIWRFIQYSAYSDTMAELFFKYKVYSTPNELVTVKGKNCEYRSIKKKDKPEVKKFLNSLNFKTVNTYVMFWGFGASGHSWIGAVLDGSPNALIANEFNAMASFNHFKKRDKFFHKLAKNSVICARYGRIQVYNYSIPGLWQGTIENELKVIGDKKGGRTALLMMKEGEKPWLNEKDAKKQKDLYNKLLKRVKVQYYRMIIVLRNPFNIIATRMLRKGYFGGEVRKTRNKSDKNEYDEMQDIMTETLNTFRELLWAKENLGQKDHWYIMRQEDFATNTRQELKLLCQFTNMECPPIMMNKAAELTRHSIHNTWEEIKWKRRFVMEINDFISEFLHQFYTPISLDSPQIIE